MRRSVERLLDSPWTPLLAAAISLALGLFFIFAWSPLPWGWQGIDFYQDRGRALFRGEPFATADYPWGYAYFIAACYSVFGERAWVPLVVQALANATVPLLLYHLVRPLTTRRTAVLAALLTGLFSFNTVYVSTQASDSICTVLFIGSLLCFSLGHRRRSVWLFAISGLLAGAAPQFRPNMILWPVAVIVLYLALQPRSWRTLVRVTMFAAFVGLALSPWVVRTYQLTGLLMPTTTRGGEQLWYGTLQVGPYLESRAHNPRTAFKSAAFDYTSIVEMPIEVWANVSTCDSQPVDSPALVFWTGQDAQRRRVAPRSQANGPSIFEIPRQPDGTTLYYFFEATRRASGERPAAVETTPADGADNPLVFFVSSDHLGDLDRRGDLIDVFDVVRLVRHLAWGEAMPDADRWDADRDGDVDQRDLESVLSVLLPDAQHMADGPPFRGLTVTAESAQVNLSDGEVIVPRDFAGRQTDLAVRGELAEAVVSRWRSFDRATPGSTACLFAQDIGVNQAFYRLEPHQLRRFTALALDNIGRDPVAFAAASAYRMVRMFIIRGTDDPATTQQFAWGRLAYGAGQWLSTAYLLVFVGGVVVAWRQRSALLVLVVPIAYIPLTICFVLTNMRYTLTVQPLMFAFASVALVAALRLDRSGEDGEARS